MDDNYVLEVSTSLEEQATSFRHVTSQVYSRNEFVDCTLCCADGQLQAHRIVLAFASTYLHSMLSGTPWPTPCSFPMLFFKAFSVGEMRLALDFIYTGTTKVTKSKLPVLMNIARDLGCSSLSKAIEKAIHSCGVEIFRQRMHGATASVSSKSASSSPYTVTGQEERMPVDHYQKLNEDELRLSNQVTHETNDVSQSPSCNEEEQHYSSNEIKVESEESMMLEIDPASIVSTTIGAAASETQDNIPEDDINNQHVCISTSAETHNENFLRRETENVGTPEGKSGSIHDGHEEEGDTEARNNEDTMPHATSHQTEKMGNEHGHREENEEEMPITVVDLKSLAETDSTEGEVMSAVGNENSESLPSNCPWCFQIFTSLTLLQRHIKTHVGKYKPHSCPYCPASFARSAHLKRHIRTHTGEKPFTCTLCNRAFSRQDKLKTHLEKHLLEQQLQNNAALASTANLAFPSINHNQSTFNVAKTTVSVTKALTSSSGGISPHKESMSNSTTQFISSLVQCPPPPPTSAYQYYATEGSDPWSQSDRISNSKGLSAPVAGSAPCVATTTATITPIPPFSAYKNASSHL